MKKTNTIYIIILTVLFLVSGGVYADSPLPEGGSAPRTTDNPLLPPLDEGQQQMDPNELAAQNGSDASIGTYAAIDTAIAQTEVDPSSQAAVYNKGEQSPEDASAEVAKTSLVEAVGCSAGQILGNIMSSLIGSAINAALSAVTTAVAEEAGASILFVPVNESGRTALNSNIATNADYGTAVGFKGIGVLVGSSWNSVAYCLVNAMITYVANSTIAWIQGGFEGNPSFVDNPEEFFRNLANVEAGAFLKELAYGTAGLNICEPFRAQIVLSIARGYLSQQQGYGGNNGYSRGGFGGGGGGGYGGCTLDDTAGSLENFLSGDFQTGGWSSWFQISQVDSNNPYTTFFNLDAQLSGSISKKQDLASTELNWGKGFLSFRKCSEKTPKEDQDNCPITSPGVVIQGQLEKTLGLAKDRLVLAEKFDQVVAALVDQLVTIALDKVLETE